MTGDSIFFGVNLGSNSVGPDFDPATLVGKEVTVDVFQYVTWMTGPGEDDYDGGNDFFGTLKGTVVGLKGQNPNFVVIKPSGFKPNVKDAPFNPDYRAEMERCGLYRTTLTPDGNYEDWYYNVCLEGNK
jgi:hypothetical protein